MRKSRTSDFTPSRRDFLATTAAATAATALPLGGALAAGRATYRRYNVMSHEGQFMLRHFAVAIRAMHQEPVTSPFNMYRYAMIHTMDCPHGNWWFLPWHRAYLGYFEQICRKLCKFEAFTIPYWDWSNTPRIPDGMFADFLTPTTRGFIPTYAEFHSTYASQVDAMYRGFSAAQNADLAIRNYATPADMWKDIEEPPNGPMFFDLAKARGLTPAKPQLDNFTTRSSSSAKVHESLAPIEFLLFGSDKTDHHSNMAGFAPLEAFPHNKIHNCVGGIVYNDDGTRAADNGGFMQANLSPVDPIFFLHHSNIDRIWDVWTRKQQAYNLPTTPLGADKVTWEQQPLLFYTDGNGNNVPHRAGEYVTIGNFDYDYQPGTGEDVVPTAKVAAGEQLRSPFWDWAAGKAPPSTKARVVLGALGGPVSASAKFTLPAAALAANSTQFAKIVIDIPPGGTSAAYKVLLNAPANGETVGINSPNFVELLTFFGHDSMSGPISFVVPLPRQKAGSSLMAAAQEQTLSVVSEGGGGGLKAAQTATGAKLLSVDIVSQ